MARLTLFTFGYYGWGSSTPELVQAVDAVERSRGFKPPTFVDIRIRRAVRAPEFNGTAFENLIGQKRHRWMKELGNRQIEARTGPPIQIADPSAVNDLLDLAIEAAEDRRRIIFFCGCEFPRENGQVACHRTKVASLTLQAAKRRGLKVEIVEWPGGKPVHVDLDLAQEDFTALLQGRWSIPASRMPLSDSAGIPWGSTATIRCEDEAAQAVVGPAQFRRREWQLPVFVRAEGASLSEMRQESALVRKAFGYAPIKT